MVCFEWRAKGLPCVTAAALWALMACVGADRLAGQEPSAEEAAIRAAGQAYAKAFEAGDAKALAAAWTSDAEYVDDSGRAFQGRDAIERHFSEGFKEQRGAKLEINVASIRMLGPDVALESGSTRVRPAIGRPGPLIKYSAVQVKRDGKWFVSNVTESRYAPQSNELYLKDLAWLVGQWQSQAGGKAIEFQCQWLPGKSFLSRTYTVTQGGSPISSGTQLIGWDPTLSQIVSWTFTSDGSFGHEFWSQSGNRWEIDASSTLSNGATSLARNVLTKLNDNTFTWRSVDRSLNDVLLPDTAEVRIKRAAAKPSK